MSDAKLELEVTLENGQFKVKSKEVEGGVKKTGQAVDKSAKSFSKFGLAMKGAALVGGALFIKFMKSSIKAASDLQEVSSKFRTVFADNMGIANRAVRELSEGYAMSTREAREHLSSVQDLLVPMGMNSEAAANMSSEVVKLAADLGSFNNLPTERVMESIQSALVGNWETMKAYGVVLNETVVKQEALRQGVWNGVGAINAATKAQVAYSLIVKGSTAAIGDMERTQDSYVNSMKRWEAATEDLSAAIGEDLLPQLADIATAATKAARAVGGFFKEMKVKEGAYKKFFELKGRKQPGFGATNMDWDTQAEFEEYLEGFKENIKLQEMLEENRTSTRKKAAERSKTVQPVPGAGTVTKPEVDPELMDFATRADALRMYHDTRITAEEESIEKERQLQIQAASNYEQYLNAKLGLDSVYWQGVQTVANTASIFLAQENKKLFRFGQILAVSQAWINTFLGMTKAYAQLGPIGGPIGAGVVFAAGVLQTKKIAAQKPPEYATGSFSVPETSPAIVHKGEMIIPKTFADSVRKGETSVSSGGGGMPDINVGIDGEVLFKINERYRDDAAQNMGSSGSFPVESAY